MGWNNATLSRIWTRQQIFIMVAVIVYAIFWAIGQPGPIGINLIYALTLGNVTLSLLDSLETVYCKQGRFRWGAYLAVLLAITPVAVFLASTLAFWADTRPLGGHFEVFPRSELFWRYQGTSWKFPFIATLTVGILMQLFVRAKARLEHRNRELQHSVQLEIEKRELQEQELDRAREIQLELLPREIPQISGFEIAASWEPARVVGGDYFDVIKLGDEQVAVCIADVVGKSVSAALLMANVQATVRAFASASAAPSWVCSRVNSVLCSNIAPGKFVTLLYGILDEKRRTFRYTNAGHLRPVLISSGGIARRLENGGALLGVFPNWKYEDSIVQLAAGDQLVLFTDGITEAATANSEEFGEERLLAVGKALAGMAASQVNRLLVNEVKKFCNCQLQDDATLINISVLAVRKQEECEVTSAAPSSSQM